MARHCSSAYQGAPEPTTSLGVPGSNQNIYLSPNALHYGEQIWLRAVRKVPLVAMGYDTEGKLWVVDRLFRECCLELILTPKVECRSHGYTPSGFRPYHYMIPTVHPEFEAYQRSTYREPAIFASVWSLPFHLRSLGK
jgi:hypothetical protein